MSKILLAEDDFTLARLMSEVIRDFGYDIQTAFSSEDAEAILVEEGPFDLLLTDIGLKRGIDGFELARRARILSPELKVLYVSGDAQRTSTDMGEVTAPILQKPVPPDELGQAIADVLAG
jgi:CheY-like chemotaxis protein